MNRLNLIQKPILAMAQPAALPGTVRYGGTGIGAISRQLIDEVGTLADGGVNGVILQNFNDGVIKQQAPLEATAFLTRLACDLRHAFPDLVLGILTCWDGVSSLAVAEAAEADFVRVEHVYCGAELTAAGILEGQCAQVQQLKQKLCATTEIYADVYEPHAVQLCPQPIEAAAMDTVFGGMADGLFLCGKTVAESMDIVQRVRAKLPKTPCICGGGSTAENVGTLLSVYDGVCVGQWIKGGSLHNAVDPERLGRYMDAVKCAREASRQTGANYDAAGF